MASARPMSSNLEGPSVNRSACGYFCVSLQRGDAALDADRAATTAQSNLTVTTAVGPSGGAITINGALGL